MVDDIRKVGGSLCYLPSAVPPHPPKIACVSHVGANSTRGVLWSGAGRRSFVADAVVVVLVVAVTIFDYLKSHIV